METNDTQNTCPICENNCKLSAPRCGRGAAHSQREMPDEKPDVPHCHHEASGAEKLMMLFRRCFLAMGRGHHHHDRGAALPGQGRILGFLSHHGKISQRRLVEETGLRPSSLGELLQKIEKSGYIVREPDEADKRSMIISLTELGKKNIKLIQNERHAQAKRLFSALTESEQESLAALLKKLADAWHMEAEHGPLHEHRHDHEGHMPHHHHGHHHGCHHGRHHDHNGETGAHHQCLHEEMPKEEIDTVKKE